MSASAAGGMGWTEDPLPPPGRFGEDLVGLDPNDPDAQAFAAHLDRMERSHSSFTVEGYLADVGDFASSANRAGGLRRVVAVGVVGLLLLVVVYTLWNAIVATLSMLS
jgi:hypothetical protein